MIYIRPVRFHRVAENHIIHSFLEHILVGVSIGLRVSKHERCERSVGTVFQLFNPDAIYSRDEEKERRWLPPLVVRVCAQPMRCWAKVGDRCRSKVRDRKEGSD
jgi:hypothetical protein